MKLQDLYETKEKSFKDVYGDRSSEKMDGDSHCSHSELTSLEGASQIVGGDFDCSNNQLTSLEGAPLSVGGSFYCYNNQLTSLEGTPPSLDGNFLCYNNKLTSLKNIHKQIKSLNGIFDANLNPITSHVIGLILIPGCTRVRLLSLPVQVILNKYMGKGKAGLVDCAEELIKAGFPEMAKL